MKTLLGMRMSSALRGCCLAVAALAMACGTTSTSTTGTTGGATTGGSTTGGTTGLACFKVGTHCPNGTGCCTGETCDSNFYCVAASATTGGTTTGSATGGDPCVLSGAGGACGTSIDCQADLFCVNSLCTAPDTTQATCTQNGTGPTALAPCCETDANGACVQWQACTQFGRACADGGPVCCNGTSCGTDGTCDAVCGGVATACTQDSDCCSDQGFTCGDGTIYGFKGKVCLPGLAVQLVGSSSPGSSYYCVDFPYCQTFDAGINGVIECQLDAICNYGDGGTNPCAQDGLICDPTYNSCRNPGFFDPCTIGGPACNTVGGTTSPLICSPPIFGQTAPGFSACTFACTSSTDCVEPFMSCFTQNGDDVCVFSNDPSATTGNNCGPLNFNGVCNSSAGNDGVCLAAGGDTSGVCIQADTDGDGGPQTVCNINGNRQIGGLCDTHDICTGNLCQPVCNASDSQSASRGGCATGLTCLPLLLAAGTYLQPLPSTDADTAGSCVTTCDITAPGTCVPTAAGLPTRCIPAELLQYNANEVPDFCGVSNGVDSVPLGGDCSKTSGDAIDPCVDGAICVGTPRVCQKLCEDKQLGDAGVAGGCQTGYTCNAINFTGSTASTHTGACLPVTDGG